jgi:hypothetical protein
MPSSAYHFKLCQDLNALISVPGKNLHHDVARYYAEIHCCNKITSKNWGSPNLITSMMKQNF